MRKCAALTFRHDVMHGYRQEEDSVAVVSSRASAEVLLHGLHDREQLLCEGHHVMEQHLHGYQHKGIILDQQLHNCRRAGDIWI